ncbi:MAG TPA: Mu transposase C-terminal domain-containing protein [Bosea sp. (in: a-proteobacteria)]|jgi:putative transposase|uniref:Mu transposase C-terminal domain-containing protein n=1 Tax=Bosea sp. (in: a-proteobacteria) TaxID=1871050 RepID=UPI002E14C4A3|nr:Mu transposase C-terminal domain-containing protein [Bosea sp. (in: a-proteobacteria)]
MNVYIPKFRIGPTDRLSIDGIEYRMRQSLPHGYVLARVDDPGVLEDFSHERLSLLSQTSRFGFDRGAFDVAAIAARLESDADIVADIPIKEREMVLARRYYAAAFLKLEAEKKATRSDASMKLAIEQIDKAYVVASQNEEAKRNDDGDLIPVRPGNKKAALSISPRTLRKWVKAFENAGLRATALRCGYRRSGDRITPRLDPAIRRMLAEFALLYASENRPTIRAVYGKLLAALDVINRNRVAQGMPALAAPSCKRLGAEIKAMPEFDVYAGRHGLPAAMKRFLMVANGPDVERPLQRVEMDEWKIDLMTLLDDAGILEGLSPEQQEELKKKRYWVCVAIDVATRIILGMKVAAGVSAELAIETLEMVVTPKRRYADAVGAGWHWEHHGSPECIVHDQGAAFMSGAFRRTVIDLGCDPDAPPAALAWLRATIERLFRTMKDQTLAPFTGRTFGSVDAKGDYKPEERASLTVTELCQMLVRWVVDVYHNSPHAGLGGETPANAWSRLVGKFGIIPAPDRHVRRAIFGIDLNRTVTARGVRCLGLFYNCLELQAHRRHHGDVDIEVKLDPADLGHVSVRLGAGWVTVPCMRTGFDDVPTDIWLAASRDLRRRYAAEAKLTDAIVAAAIRDAWEMARKAQIRANIQATRPSQEELDRLEQQVGLGFASPEDLNSAPASASIDLMAKAIPSGKPTSAVPQSAPSRIIKPKA